MARTRALLALAAALLLLVAGAWFLFVPPSGGVLPPFDPIESTRTSHATTTASS